MKTIRSRITLSSILLAWVVSSFLLYRLFVSLWVMANTPHSWWISGTQSTLPSIQGIASVTLLGETEMYYIPRRPWSEPGYTCTTSTGADCRSYVTVSGATNITGDGYIPTGQYMVTYSYNDPQS